MQHFHVSALRLIFHQEVIKVIQPVLLGKIIEYFESNDPTDTAAVYEAYSYAAGISLSTIGLAVLHHLYFYHVQRAGMKIRVAMCHMIYRKVSHDETSVYKCNPLSYSLFFCRTLFNTFVLRRLFVLTAKRWPKLPQDKL